MFWLILSVIVLVLTFTAGYFVGSNNPAKSVIEKLKQQLKDKL